MNLKLGKSFPLLKFKPQILKPLVLDQLISAQSTFNINDPIHQFSDLIKIDCLLKSNIDHSKTSIKEYITAVKQANTGKLFSSKKQLINNLQTILQIIQKLDYQNIERDISQLFSAPYGVYQLYRYVWTPDLLHLVDKIKISYNSKQKSKQNNSLVLCSQKISQKYCQAVQQLLHKQAKILFSQFIKQMYIVPEQWGYKLIRQTINQENIVKVFRNDQHIKGQNKKETDVVRQSKLKQLLKLYVSHSSNQIKNFKQITKTLFYFEIQTQFYAYITYLKTLLLNKSSGIFNGDYQTWQQVYNICLKIYARKENLRGKHGVQIDQIIEHQNQDQQFTNYINSCNIETVSLSSMNFYYKNCPKSVQNSIRHRLLAKIKDILYRNQFKYYQDVIEYLDTQASPGERKQIIQFIKVSMMALLQKGIKVNCKFLQFQKAISDLLQYLMKDQQRFFAVINQNFLQQVLSILNNSQAKNKKGKIDSTQVEMIYTMINRIFMQAYQQQFNFDEYLIGQQKQGKQYSKLIEKIVIRLKKRYGKLMHEDVYSILEEWRLASKCADSDSQDSSSQDKQEDQISKQNQQQMCGHIALLMVVSGRDCQFKIQNYFNSEQNKQLIGTQLAKIFKILSDSLFQQRKQIDKYLSNKSEPKYKAHQNLVDSYLIVKGIKDRLLHQNIMNISIKIHPVIAFEQIANFGVQFLTLMTPHMIDQPLPIGSQEQYGTIQPFDVCDIISGQQPIQCMKLIYKKLPQFEETMFDFQILDRLPVQICKHFGDLSNNRSLLAQQMINCKQQLNMQTIDRIQDFKRFLFYVQLMNRVFSKLNQKSQKGIKEIKLIYASMQKICLKIWKHTTEKILSSEIYWVCKQGENFQNKINQINQSQSQLQCLLPKPYLCDMSVQYSQFTFNKLVKNIKLPYIDNILTNNNSISKTVQQFLCFSSSIGKVLYPQSFCKLYQKLFNPLQVLKTQCIHLKQEGVSDTFKQNYQIIGQIVKCLGMIQYTCSNQQVQQGKTKGQQKEWSVRWRNNCKQIIQNLLRVLNKYQQKIKPEFKCQARSKSLWVSVFLVHLKAQIVKILVPYLIKQPLKNPEQNPKMYNNQLQETFSIFTSLCQIVQRISPGQEDHLITFLEIFENFDQTSNTDSQKNIQMNSKLSQFLIKSIQSLLGLVFKGIRVRSYHFYKFIKSYLKVTKEKENYQFFNSIIAYYIKLLMTQIVPSYQPPQNLLTLCDENMNEKIRNPNLKQIKNKEKQKQTIINQINLKKNVNKIRFAKFVRFQAKFQNVAQKVCVISMFFNLFCRLNYKSLTQGIQKIWQTPQMHLLYIQYLQKISGLISKQSDAIDQKLFDIINVDCYGNLLIILRHPLHDKNRSKQSEDHNKKIIHQMLKLIKEVVKTNIDAKVKNSLTIPVKKILSQIKNSSTSLQTLDYISHVIGELDLSRCLQGQSFKYIKQGKQVEENKEQAGRQSQRQHSQILDMILTCYNTKLSRGITSSIHLNNLLYICKDSELKLRIMQNNMGSLERRMSRKQIRVVLSRYVSSSAHNKEDMIKSKKRRSSIARNSKLQSKQKSANRGCKQGQWLDNNNFDIRQDSQQLVKQIIRKFVECYAKIFKAHKDNDRNRNNSQIRTLFNNLKILSLVSLNNPQIVTYLLNYKVETSSNKNGVSMSVYDVLIDSFTVSLPIFTQLYLVFMKTNFGFTTVGLQDLCYLQQTQIQSDVRYTIPSNLCIQVNTKIKLIQQLTHYLNSVQSMDGNSEPMLTLLSIVSFIVQLSTCQSKPAFKCYKFGSICNKQYMQIYKKLDAQFLECLADVVKVGISKFNSFGGVRDWKTNRIQSQIILLYSDILNKILPQSDVSWMKLDLDIKLKSISNITDPSQKLVLVNRSKDDCRQLVKQVRVPDIQIKKSEKSRQISSLISYHFQHQVINQQIYNIITRLNNAHTQINQHDRQSAQLLHKMMEYSAKQIVWEGMCQDEAFIDYPSNRSDGSFGLNSLASNSCSQVGSTGNNRTRNARNSVSSTNNYNNDGIVQDEDGIIEQGGSNQKIGLIIQVPKQQQTQTVNIQYKNIQNNQEISVSNRPRSNGNHLLQQQVIQDGIVQNNEQFNDYIVEEGQSNTFLNVQQLNQCMSETSLQFLSQHSVKFVAEEEQNQQQDQSQEITKQTLQTLYQQSSINPQAKKILLRAISQANVLELEKFIDKQNVDEEIQIIVVRELWSRGVTPTTTSIDRANKYYNGCLGAVSNTHSIYNISANSQGPLKTTVQSIHINQAIMYKRMYENYSNTEQNPTYKHIPVVSKQTLQRILLHTTLRSETQRSKLKASQQKQSLKNQLSLWKFMNKLALNSTNVCNIMEICLEYLKYSDSSLNMKIQEFMNKEKTNSPHTVDYNDIGNIAKRLKLAIVNDVFSGMINSKIGLRLLLTGLWDNKLHIIVYKRASEQELQEGAMQNRQQANRVAILQYILKYSTVIDQTMQIASREQSKNSINLSSQVQSNSQDKFIHILWQYIKNCDEYNKSQSKLQKNRSKESAQFTTYPYYQIQQTIVLSGHILDKFVDQLFNSRTIVGVSHRSIDKNHMSQNSSKSQQTSLIQQLFLILVYVDPTSFQKYMQHTIDKISVRLSQIVRKQHKVLSNFQTSWSQTLSNTNKIQKQCLQMQKQQKYWSLRQSKKLSSSASSPIPSQYGCQQDLEYFRNVLVSISTNLVPKFKKLRFNYHCGTSYRNWKLQIEILKQKLLTSGSFTGLIKLDQKQKQLQNWRASQSNSIINQEIIPIVQKCSEQFINVLIEAEMFISQFLDTFQAKENKYRIVIYNCCAKLYQILLASQILTHQQKPTYHSMSKLKTNQSIQSANNFAGSSNRRKSSLSTDRNRKSARISINSCLPKVQILLRKIGPSCTFLHNYLGPEQQLRQLHAKYSDVNKRLKVLWGYRAQESHQTKPVKQKIITCRRDYIVEDTLVSIDQDFINLPVKIKFQGQIGIDYGGVTRQWITLFMKEIINPSFGLFSLSANKLTFQPNVNSSIIPNHLRFFKKIGILVGKAMKQNWLLQINLTKSFLKHILGNTLYIQDLQDIDPETAKSLKWILDNDIGFDDDLGLNFTYQFEKLGKKETIDLIPGGANVSVTQQNKKNYVKLVAKMKMTEQIRDQSKAFMSGLQSVIPYSTLSLFSHKQISLYLSGMPTIDVKQMQQYAKYENFTQQSKQIIWIWQILSSWQQQELANFLFFLTGSYKVPYGGFKQQPIGFNKLVSCVDYLPVAHTCFSVIDLSEYSSKEKMCKLLRKSINQGKGFSVS